MEGFYFFWATWISWILVTFFMRHSLARTLFAFAILLTISLSGFSVNFAGHRIFATVFLLAVIGYLFIFSSKRVGIPSHCLYRVSFCFHWHYLPLSSIWLGISICSLALAAWVLLSGKSFICYYWIFMVCSKMLAALKQWMYWERYCY